MEGGADALQQGVPQEERGIHELIFRGRYGDDLCSTRWYMQKKKREAGLKAMAYDIGQLVRFKIRLEIAILDRARNVKP